jgi:hypothetical protein
MFESDYDEFAALLDDAYDLIGSGPNKIVGAGAKSLFFMAMSKYPLSAVRAALSAHCLDRARGRFTPKPADLIDQIEMASEKDGRPGAEEAWAIALTSIDESDTVVWTQEIAEAFATCRPVLDSSGTISARKAFVEIYTRLVTSARAAYRPPEWSASLGWDKTKQSAVLARAATAGLLAGPTISALLPAPVEDPPPSKNSRVQLDKIRKILAESAAIKAVAADLALEADFREGEESKRRIAAQVARYNAKSAVPHQRTGSIVGGPD